MKRLIGVVAVAALALLAAPSFSAEKKGGEGAKKVEKAKLFIDVHDRKNGTFPAKITKEEFAGFEAKFEAACQEEGVVVLRIHVNLEEGRAYCLTSAPSAEAVRRAHQRVGLPFDGITEVTTVTPGDLFLPQ